MVPALLKAVEALQPGQRVNSPVRGPAGWHVLSLEEVRPYTAPPREALRAQLTQAIAAQRVQAAAGSLRQSAKLE